MSDTSETFPAAAATPRVASADIGRGVTWFTDAFSLFMKAPGPWLLVGIIFIVGFITLAMIPFIGQLLVNVAWPLFIAGIAVAARTVDAGGEFRSDDVTSPFSAKAEKLLILGAIYMGISIGIILVIVILTFLLAGATIGASVLAGDMGSLAASMGVLLAVAILALLALALYIPLMMAMWFAPLLVHSHGMEPFAAMKLSFSACLKNFLPFLIYGIVGMIATILAAIPFFLGFLVLLPVMFLSVYTSYKDCFTEA